MRPILAATLVLVSLTGPACSGGGGDARAIAEEEPNDSTPQELGGPGLVRFEGACESSSDVDLYAFDTSGSGTGSIAIKWSDWPPSGNCATVLVFGEFSPGIPGEEIVAAGSTDWGIDAEVTGAVEVLSIACDCSVSYSARAEIP